jgi:rare lipoprotein A
MLNWNWSCTLSTSVATLAIVLSLVSNGAQAETGFQNSAVSSSIASPLPTALKVGETRSQSLSRTQDDAIARIHTHKIDGKNAATVYVRGIPVVTYIESEESANSTSDRTQSDVTKSKSDPKGEIKKNSESGKLLNNNLNSSPNSSVSSAKSAEDSSENLLASSNPIERATAAAALINQLNRDGLDANQIVPAWKNGNYVIKLGDRATIKFDRQAVFSESLQNNITDLQINHHKDRYNKKSVSLT